MGVNSLSPCIHMARHLLERLPFDLRSHFVRPREEPLLGVNAQGLDGLHDALEPFAHSQLLVVGKELTYALLLVLAGVPARQAVHQRQQGRRVLG